MKKIKNKNIIIGIILIAILIVTTSILKKSNINYEEEKVELVTEPIKDREEKKKIKVDIKGEVNNEGVYELEENDRVSDAVKLAGGLTENADTSLINLSKNLKDEMVIIIYNKNEIEKIKNEKQPEKIIEYIEKECSCPDKINEACIKESTKEIKENPENKKISINNGTIDELTTIPGLGESKAKAIIEYREKNGEFKNLEDITNVSGIGKTTFEKFKEYITL